MDGLDRLPPHDRDAEKALLGCILHHNPSFDEAVTVLGSKEPFYVFGHQLIFEAMSEMRAVGHEIDIVTLAGWLRDRSRLEDASGPEYLVDLWDAASSHANVRRYAETVRDLGLVRKLIHACNELQRDAYDRVMPADELLEQAEKRVFAIASMGAPVEIIPQKQAVHETLEDLDRKRNRAKDGECGTDGVVETGFLDLDALIGGMHPSELTVVAARPSIGKTLVAVNFIRHAAKAKVPIFFSSIEQKRVKIVLRSMCMEGLVSSHKMRNPQFLSNQEYERITNIIGEIESWPIWYADSPRQTILKIASAARQLRAQHNIGLVVVDYLQIIEATAGRNQAKRHEVLADISWGLKQLARELNIPVCALAQLNREVDKRTNPRPKISDIKECGSIEQDADMVMLLHKPEEDQNLLEVIIGKNRDGPTGEVTLLHVKEYFKLENFAMPDPGSYR